MTPSARVQAAIEILDLVVDAARHNGASADRIIAEWFRNRRFAGSKDRRAVREWAYAAIRACGELPQSGRAAMLRLASDDAELAALFDGSTHAPAPILPDEKAAEGGVAAAWLIELLEDSGINGAAAAALLERAPLDIRVNLLKSSRDTIGLPVAGEALVAPNGLRLPMGTAVEQWDAFRAGLIEVQDGGSQLACVAVGAKSGEVVIDLCAGAGGKSLALAADMGGANIEKRGLLIAADTDRNRLARLAPRAERAGAGCIQTVLLNPHKEAEALRDYQGKADAVLVDAPCSGTGTWRRNPEARWRLTHKELARLTTLQARLMDVAAGLVKSGGRLVYVTCSLLDAEGANQAEAFLVRNPDWRASNRQAGDLHLGAGTRRGHGIRLDPHRDGTDGFFIVRLQKL